MKLKKILIIDDDKVFLKVLEDGLKMKGGYKIFTAVDGEEGISLAIKENPDVILTDLMMPKVDGLNFIRTIRSHEELSQTPVFILSQLEDPEKMAEGAALGIRGYIIKSSLSLDNIIERIENA